tara:strand:- start:1396 stop:1947 length:552 start_codon:yes stop_codon:yes gene_type:complete
MTYNQTDTVLCKKHDIVLKKIKNEKLFTLEFISSNKNIDVKNIIDIHLYRVIAEINKDIIEKIDIFDDDTDIPKILLVFKRFGSEFGVAQKYMYLNVIREEKESLIKLSSKSIPCILDIDNCEIAKSNKADLHVNIIDKHSAHIKYYFYIDFNEELPIYMENLPGFLMKKIFVRLKTFIENLK